MPYATLNLQGEIKSTYTKPSPLVRLQSDERMVRYDPPDVDLAYYKVTPVTPIIGKSVEFIVEEKVDHQQLEDTLAPVKDFAAVSRVDWRPKCSRILDRVKSQYFWPQHFIFSFCSIPLKICHSCVGCGGKERIVPRPHPGTRHYFFYYRD